MISDDAIDEFLIFDDFPKTYHVYQGYRDDFSHKKYVVQTRGTRLDHEKYPRKSSWYIW